MQKCQNQPLASAQRSQILTHRLTFNRLGTTEVVTAAVVADADADAVVDSLFETDEACTADAPVIGRTRFEGGESAYAIP